MSDEKALIRLTARWHPKALPRWTTALRLSAGTDRCATPQSGKARQGVQLTNLSIDPETSKVVQQIFDLRAEGIGFLSIATCLTEQGLPCPSASDRERNPHRHGRAWSVGAVRAIVMNSKYKGG